LALLQRSLVEAFVGFRSAFSQASFAELNPVRSLSLYSYYQYQLLGTLLEIMLADEHLRTYIAHITLVLGSYLK
jgi:hypothetical protein